MQSNTSKLSSYQHRMHKVFNYIHAHLSEDLCLDELSQVADFSRYHFHRQFAAYIGINVFKYIQLMRMKRASHLLAFRKEQKILDIALCAGFDSSEAFARAFKKLFSQTPTEFRKNADWQSWRQHYQFLNSEGMYAMQTSNQKRQINIVQFPEMRVATLQHRRSPELLMDSIKTFIKWRKENRLSPDMSATYNIIYDDPAATESEKYQLDLCAAIKNDIDENIYGIVESAIPAGRCARLRHLGPDNHLGDSIEYLYTHWLPASGEELRDFPCFLHRVDLFPDVPEHEIITDIYLPLL